MNMDRSAWLDWTLRIFVAIVLGALLFFNAVFALTNAYYLYQFNKVIERFRRVTKELEQESKDAVWGKLNAPESACMGSPMVCREESLRGLGLGQ